MQLLLPNPDRHSLTKIDEERRTADCSICGPGVPIRVRERKGRGGNECHRAYLASRRRTPADYRRNTLRKYGITPAQYHSMAKRQAGLCAICGEQPEGVLYVDHCHASGKVRGLLCRDCNFAIGFLRDSAQSAQAAASYLRLHSSPRSTEPPEMAD